MGAAGARNVNLLPQALDTLEWPSEDRNGVFLSVARQKKGKKDETNEGLAALCSLNGGLKGTHQPA